MGLAIDTEDSTVPGVDTRSRITFDFMFRKPDPNTVTNL
jgi:hypothetical protein